MLDSARDSKQVKYARTNMARTFRLPVKLWRFETPITNYKVHVNHASASEPTASRRSSVAGVNASNTRLSADFRRDEKKHTQNAERYRSVYLAGTKTGMQMLGLYWRELVADSISAITWSMSRALLESLSVLRSAHQHTTKRRRHLSSHHPISYRINSYQHNGLSG